MFGRASSLVSDAMWTILPAFFAIIVGSTACATTNGAVRLVAITASQSAGANSTIGPRRWMPALLNRMSMPPRSATIAATAECTAARSVTSNTLLPAAKPSPRSLAAASSASADLRALSTTVAPARASPAAIAKPSPRYAPVTSATFPERSKNGSVMRRAPELRRHPLSRGRRRLGRAERRHQLRFLLLRRPEVAVLDVPVAADLLRDARNLDRDRVVVRAERSEQLLDQRFVVGDELALHPALRGAAEDVQRRSAQPSHLREHAERAHHPGTVAALSWLARVGVGLVHQRRGEMEHELVVALELRRHALREIGFGEKARDFVLVLDREQLEVVTRHRLGERGATGNLLGFGRADPGDEIRIEPGVRRILVAGQEFHAAGDGFVQRRR